MLDINHIIRRDDEPRMEYVVRAHRQARNEAMRDVELALAEVPERTPLLYTVKLLIEIVDDIISEGFV